LTPNFDKLARESIVFKNAYVQYSLCGPSRTSILTGRRPDTTRIFGNVHYWRTAGGNFTTLPQYFKDSGYVCTTAGKIFHPSKLSSNNSDPISWSEPVFSKYLDGRFEDSSRLPSWHAITKKDRDGMLLTDEYAVEHIIDRMHVHAEKARTGEQPIFVALGFRKPHIST
jgi:iduronate 2-sulfatase